MGQTTGTRLLSAAELAELSRSPRQELADVLERDPQGAPDVFRRLDRSYRNFIGGFTAWVVASQDWLAQQYGPDGLTAVASLDETLRSALFHGLTQDDLDGFADPERPERVAALCAGGDAEAALAAFEELESSYRRLHHVQRDRVTSLLGQVYRAYGVDVLEACMRHAGEQTLVGWMPHDVARPADVRVRQWATMQKGNFADISVSETDEAFIITLQPCGTCGRQVADGCYGDGLGLAVVEETHPITFGRGHTPVYRTHVAVMHFLLPVERTGVPWPVIQCPPGLESAPCRVLLYKDPQTTPPELFAFAEPPDPTTG